MIKKIKIEDLKPGMFIVDVTQLWSQLLSLEKSMYVEGEQLIQKLKQSGFSEIFVDTAKTIKIKNKIVETPPQTAQVFDLKEEFKKAEAIQAEARNVYISIMKDVQSGKKIAIEQVNEVVGKVVESITFNPRAMVGLNILQQKNKYLFDRGVSCCVLMVLFANHSGLDETNQQQLGTAALLHDIGMVNVPSQIMNKPGELNAAEKQQVTKHVSYGINILKNTPGISEEALLIASQHHERMNGSGYPAALKKDQISLYGQMAAIVDVYDALTSDRGYKKGVQPTTALREILTKSNDEFNTELVNAFIQAIGIYPFGSLLRLKNGLIGVVIDPKSNDLLYPTLRIFYDANKGSMIKPYELDLQRHKDTHEYKIVAVETRQKLFLEVKDIINILAA